MRGTTDNRATFRAVFLAAIMVISMAAMGFAAVGTVAADQHSYQDDIDVGFTLDGSESEEVVAGAEDQELALLVITDDTGDLFSGTTTVTLPDGFSVTEGTEDDLTITGTGDLTVDDFTVSDDGQSIQIEKSGSSNDGDAIRINNLVVDTEPDIEAALGGATNELTVTYAVGENDDVGIIDGFKADLDADADNSDFGPVPASGSTALAGDDTLTIGANTITPADGDDRPAQIGAGGNIVLSVNETEGITYDTDEITAEDIVDAISGSEDGEVDADGVSVTETDITIPVTEDFADDDTLSLNADEIVLAAAGDAEDTSNFEASVEAANTTGVVETDTDTEDDIAVNRPDFEYDEFSLDVGADSQDVDDRVALDSTDTAVLAVTATANDQLTEGSSITFELNNSDVTFDDTQDLNAVRWSDGDSDTENISDNGAEIEIDGTTLEITLPDDIEDLEFDDIENGDQIYVGSDDASETLDSSPAPETVDFNVTGAPADETAVAITATTGADADVVSDETSENTITLDRPATTFSGESADEPATIFVDNVGEEDILIEPDEGTDTVGTANSPVVIDFSSVETQIGADTNVTIELAEDSDVTFDTSVGTNLNSLTTTTDEIGAAAAGGSGEVDFISVSETEIDIGINDAGDVEDNLNIDRLVTNATADAVNSSVTVTYNTGEYEITEEIEDAIEPETDEIDDVTLSGDENIEVSEDSESLVEVDGDALADQSNADDASFAGADVELNLTDQPETTDFDTADVVTDVDLVTDDDGEAEFNFSTTAAGTYEITANASGVEDTITYTVDAGEADSLDVDGAENAFRGAGIGTDSIDDDNVLRAAVYEVTVLDEDGNAITTGEVDIEVDVDKNVIAASDQIDDGKPAGNDELLNGDVAYDAGNDDDEDGTFYVFIESSTAGDVEADFIPFGDSAGVDSDAGSVTFYDFAEAAELDLTDTAEVDSNVTGTASVLDDEGNVIDVPHIDVDFDSDNTTVAEIDEEDSTTDRSGEASVTLDTLEEGVTNVSATFDDAPEADDLSDEVTLTVEDVEEPEANFTLELVDGPTEIVQNTSYDATVNVSNIGDAGVQDITYALEDDEGAAQIEAAEEDVELNASESTELTFDVDAEDTEALEAGNYTHVFATDNDELRVDVEVIAEDDLHPSGITQEQFDAINADGGDLTLGELRDAVSQWSETNEVNGVSVNLGDLRNVVNWWSDQQ